MENNKKRNKWIYIIYAVLLIVIVLLLLNNFIFKNKNKKEKIETGNIDIFEIKCNKENCQNNNQIEKSTWKSNNTLRIISNPMYQIDNIISNSYTNAYVFKIKNNTNYKVNYSISFIENTSMNIKYRLKRENTYIKGNENNWVSYKELNIYNQKLDNSSIDTYYLEWKYENIDDIDIKTLDNNYQLKMQINAQEIK